MNNHRDAFVFPKGELQVNHHATSHHESFDPRTCLDRVSERGTYRVVAGTGRYRHATGHGTYRLTGYFAGCTDGDPNNFFTQTIQASGPLSY
ncbi:MAG: hypothetical protein ACJ71T_07310 [Actinomycetales bacterium]